MLVSCTYLNNKFIHTYIHILDKKTVIYMYTCKSRMLYLPKYLKKKKKEKKIPTYTIPYISRTCTCACPLHASSIIQVSQTRVYIHVKH